MAESPGTSLWRRPPQSGMPFFLLWLAGLLVQSVAMRLIFFAMQGGAAQGSVVFAALGIAAHVWQAWLLFRPGGRFAVWSLTPLLAFVVPRTWDWIQLLGIIVPIIESILLRGVRLRPWAWLLAGMGQVIVMAITYKLINVFLIGRNLGLPMVSSAMVVGAASSGMWLLCEAAAAAVLAWWMPPIKDGSDTAPPLPPSSNPG